MNQRINKMGCGASARVTDELQQLQQQLAHAREASFSAADDRQALGVEVQQLRSHVSHLVNENEILKQKVDKVMANGHPEIFGDTQGVNDMIANWMEMDMRDGDELLVALGRVHPHSLGEVEAMLAQSSDLRQQESTLEEYYQYFERRFKVFQAIWARVVGIHFHMDEAFKRFKDSMATNLLSIEPILGKKSPAMDELRAEVRNLMNLEYAEFMDEQWRLQNKIIQIRNDYSTRRVDEKEQEKQRFFAKCDADNKALKAKHQLEIEQKQEEIKGILEERRRQEEHAQKLLAMTKDTHSGRTQLLKQLMHEKVSKLKEQTQTSLQEFAAYQAEVKLQLKQFTEEQERQIAALKAKHLQEKTLMRALMTKANAVFRSDYSQLASDFQTNQQEVMQEMAAFCDSYSRQYDARIAMLLEDARCEARRRDEKSAREKQAVLKMLSALRSSFTSQSSDFVAALKDTKDQLKAFCEHTTAYFNYVNHNASFALDQTCRQYESKLGMTVEDCRAEMGKRDRETAALHEFYQKQKQFMRDIMRRNNNEFRTEVATLKGDFQQYLQQTTSWLHICLREAHDEHSYALRQEGLARSQMLVEEHIQEIAKRDQANAETACSHQAQLSELREQFLCAETVLKEDAVLWVLRLEENTDHSERKRAKALEVYLNDHLTALEGSYSASIEASTTALASLQPYGLSIPPPATPESAQLEPEMLGKRISGAMLYSQAVANLRNALSKSQQAAEVLLQDRVKRENWLVSEWLQLESRRQALQTQLKETTSAYEGQVSQLQQELKDFSDLHSDHSTTLSQNIASLEAVIQGKEADLEQHRSSIAVLKQQLDTSVQESEARKTSIEELQLSLFGKSEEVVTCQGKIEELEKTTVQLQEEIKENERKYTFQKQGKAYRRMILDFKHKVSEMKRSFLLKWRVLAVPQVAPARTPEPVVIDNEDSLTEDDDELDLVEEFLQEEKRLALENNVMVENFNKAGAKPERPLTIPQALKFFEDMMDKKYDADVGDIKNGRPLRTLPDFFLEFLSRTFGLKKLAVKMLCQIIPTLELMNSDGSPYCQLFCRLVQVSHPDPVPFPLAVFLTRVRIEFSPLAEKYSRDKEARDSRKGIKREVGKGKGKDVNTTGGEAYLLDIMGYVSNIFEGDRRSSELMLKLIQPSGIETVDYVVFRLCNKISKQGITLENAFLALDKDGRGAISESEFVRASRRSLELWVPAEDLSLCFRMVTSGAREMTKEMFLSKINFKSYLENCKSDLYIVSRVNFLLSLIEVYHTRQKHDGARIKSLIGPRAITQESFEALVRKLEPNIESPKIAALYSESLKLTTDPEQGVGVGATIKVLLRHPVGVLKNSPFCKNQTDMKELEQDLTVPAQPEENGASPPASSPSPRPDRKAGAKKAGTPKP